METHKKMIQLVTNKGFSDMNKHRQIFNVTIYNFTLGLILAF